MGSIHLEQVYPVSKETLWQHLVMEPLLTTWGLAVEGFQLEIGNQFVEKLDTLPNPDEIFHNTVLEFDPLDYLVYRCTNDKHKLNSIVTWELQEVPEGTKLRFSQSGFAASHLIYQQRLHAKWKEKLNLHLKKKFIAGFPDQRMSEFAIIDR